MEYKKLGDIATYINGYAFKPEDRGSEGLPIIRIQDLTGNSYDLGFFSGDYPKKVEINNGDVLISWSASLGVYIWSGGKALLNQHIFKVDFDKVEVNKQYFVYAVKYNLKVLESKTHGATMKHIVKKDFDNTVVPFPTLEKQNDIANILAKIENIINLRKLELDKLDELVKARFVEMFEMGDYPKVSVELVCSEIVDCPHTTPKYEGELINPAIRTAEIKKGYIDWETMRYVSDDEYMERTARLIPEAGDIVYGREGTIGNAAILPKGYKFCLGQRVMLLRPDYKQCTSEYLLHAVISDDVILQAKAKNNMSTVAHVNVKDVKQFMVPLPELGKQNQFADFVKQVDKSKVAIQSALDQTQQLFDSLMQEYFG
jgi:type I restriction enzyme S subunit